MSEPKSLRDRDVLQHNRSPERQAWLFALLVCCAVFGLVGWRASSAYHRELAEGQVISENLAGSLAEHASGVVRDADIVLAGLVERVRTDGVTGSSLERLHRMMMARVAAVPTLHHLVLFSPAGDALAASVTPMPPVNVADRAYFVRHRSRPGNEVLVGPALQNRVDNRWSITVSRRVDGPDGSFAGVLVAVVDVGTFTDFYAGFDIGSHGSVTLLDDGMLIARQPAPANPGSLNRRASQGWRWVGNAGAGRIWSPIDGLARSYSFHRAGTTPLLVIVGLAEVDILASWTRDTLIALAAATVISGLLSLLGWRLARQIRLRHAAELAATREAWRAGESEAQLATYIDHLPDGVLVIRSLPAGGILFERANAAANVLLGIGRLNNTEPHQVMTQWHADAVAANINDCVATGVPKRFRSVIAPDYGEAGRVVEVHLSPVRPTSGASPALVLASLRDITTQVELQAQLLQAQRMEAVGQLTAGIAHDFNNMLQALMGGLEMLQREVTGRVKATRQVEAALEAVAHGAKLTHGLLAFSRKQVLRPETIDAAALLQRLAGLLSRTLDPRIELDFSIDPSAGLPLADPAQLEAALLNLCLNARDAMAARGGRLSIRVENGTADGNDNVVLAVTDEGDGMDEDTLARACEPFFTTKEVGHGSGLGLSMVQGFAQQSGGALRLQSAAGAGTRIEIWLPRAGTSAALGPAEPARAAHRSSAKLVGRVLLVDDDEIVRETVAEMLEQAGLAVVQAASGEKAATLLRSDLPFDGLITDYAMPGMTGGELVQQARQLRPGLPAIVTTGYADTDRLGHVPAGTTVLRKPFRADQLVDHLRPALQSASRPEPISVA